MCLVTHTPLVLEIGHRDFTNRVNTHDTSRKVIILRVGWGPVTKRVSPVTKTLTSINSIS
jgi:hypothetical protein